MKFKAIAFTLLAGAAVAANAQVLTGVSAPTLGDDWAGYSVTPSYGPGATAGLSTGTLPATTTDGLIDGWKFDGTASAGHYITSITFTESFSGASLGNSYESTVFTAKYLAGGHNVYAGLGFVTDGNDGISSYAYDGSGSAPAAGYNDATDPFTLTFNVSSLKQSSLEFDFDQDLIGVGTGTITAHVTQAPVPEPASFATVAFGIAGLFGLRLRRRSI